MQNPPSIHSISIEQELVRLKGILADLQGFLASGFAPVPGQVVLELDRLSAGLEQLLERARGLEQERQHLYASVRLGHVVNSSLDLDVILQIMMDTLIQISGAERGFFMLPDEEGAMKMRLARNWEQESLDPAEIIYSSTIVNRVITSGQPVLTTNASEDPRFRSQNSVALHNLRSILCVPLKIKDQVTGVIYADHSVRAGLFTRKELDLLVAFADQAAVAIENARLFASVRQTLAEVTGLKILMDNVLASVTSAVLTVDPAGIVALCNRAGEELFGLPAGSAPGRALFEIAPGLEEGLRPLLEYVLSTHQPVIARDIRFCTPQGACLDLQASLSTLRAADSTGAGVTIILEDLTEKKKLEAQRRMFERMVSPAVIDQLDPNSLRLGGHRAEITILFADLRAFTPFSEVLQPEELVSILNCYLAAAAEAVLQEGGTVDKFLGDAVMAWFNAPVAQPDHTLRAVRAALSIQERIKKLHASLPEPEQLQYGIGIHVGDAVMGLVGSERRLEYTAIGDTVNTARRIQENAAGGQILISEAAYQRVSGQVAAAEVEPIQAKGKRDQVRVYQLLCLS